MISRVFTYQQLLKGLWVTGQKNSPFVKNGLFAILLLENMPVALEEEGGDDGDVEHTDAGGEEVCCAVDVVVGDGADGSKADDIEAEFTSFE